MNTLDHRLSELQAEDIMSRDVVVVEVNNTMSEAAHRLSEHQISGAPVIDEQGRCVGVLSSADFVQSKATRHDSETDHKLRSNSSAGGYQIENVLHDLVRHHMSPAVQTIDQKCSLLHAARCMCAEHFHRLIVIDDNNTPLGVITSLDLVAALISSADEQEFSRKQAPK